MRAASKSCVSQIIYARMKSLSGRRSPMSSKLAKLASAYREHLTVPWQAGLAAIQRVIFAVYDKTDELRLRANIEEFALVTQQAGKQWLLLDEIGRASCRERVCQYV